MLLNSKKIILVLFVCLIATFTACDESNISNETPDPQEDLSVDYVEGQNAKKSYTNTGGFTEGVYSEHLAEVNSQLAEKGFDNIQLLMAETITITNEGGIAAGQTIFANDRTKTLPAQWQANDPIRSSEYGTPVGNDLTHTIFTPFAPANGGTINSEPDIDASFETWNNLKKNSGLDIIKVPTPDGVFPSAIISLTGLVNDPFVADISTIGFLPGFLFDAVLGPGSSSSVLGVTFTFTWVAAPDVVALKEVWYNDDFEWSSDGSPGTIDIETVALHENGHALGFGHFGKIFVTDANGKLHVSPRAVMNAAYLGPVRDPLGTDKASFNNVYGSWPKD